jgi:hypothetical protein
MDDGTFPALLKTLSDSSEEVIKHDLQLLAQISSSSEETYFKAFMVNLLELFSTDRRLLETRGSLIIRQLCLNLNTERIYRTFAEIIEKEDVSARLQSALRIPQRIAGSRVCERHRAKAKCDSNYVPRTRRFQETTQKPGNEGYSVFRCAQYSF